jgi:LysM repeat protein
MMPDTTSTHPVRLTRRGRALLVLLLAALLLAAFSLGSQATQAAGVAGKGAPVELEQTTVQPGESLWSVAQRIAPDNDPREVVAQIRSLNDLESSRLQVGQHLLLPAAA